MLVLKVMIVMISPATLQHEIFSRKNMPGTVQNAGFLAAGCEMELEQTGVCMASEKLYAGQRQPRLMSATNTW